uniref:Guided entry of tail-anchored proteins factor 1 n=1 Tax=Syphacia muris TaxID=451379 RepID=A0A0N5AJG1_9BILA
MSTTDNLLIVTEAENSYEVFRIFICVLGALLFTNIFSVFQYAFSKLAGLMRNRIANSKEAVDLTLELEKKKRELDLLSPTEQFAAYFKTERVYNRLKAEHSQLVSAHQKEHFTSLLIAKFMAFVVIVTMCAVMSIYSRDVCIGHVNSDYFWPLNSLLHLPNISCSYGSKKGTPVSLFSMFCLCSSVLRLTVRRFQRKQKED